MRSHQGSLIIEAWILKNVQCQGYKRYDDLHIDQIDPMWGPTESWIDGGLEAFRLAKEIRNQHRLDLRVVLAFSLVAGDVPRGINFRNLSELRPQFNPSPPSLYLYEKGKEPWTESGILDHKVVAEIVARQELDTSSFPQFSIAKHAFYIEFKQVEFDEYFRSILIEG